MTSRYSGAVETARDYYNSNDADTFYHTVWGGEDIHVGLYEAPSEPIFDASRRTVERMAGCIPKLDGDTRVLDIGAGYGGAARFLAQRYGCQVVALNLSEKENDRARQMNRQQGLDELIEVIDGSFEDLPFNDRHFDVVWSQDAILHSGNRRKVLEEVARVLAPGGHFLFTDPMQADDCPAGVLQPILERIHLATLGSPEFYRRTLTELDLEEVSFDIHSDMLAVHYGRVHDELTSCEERLAEYVSRDYIERMKHGLQHWIEGGRNGHLTWGIFLFRKPGDAPR
ncbi:class I SAM-dependent methyltransferase [Nitrococcus mobilis]|uniref:Putative sarcosine-dimethylglycine methyltransferase n=1 Tax=Nitrococcus mobilis Nb-231 TaxID=314278 RepID=A4BNS9_9GAMM|nr:class I SAM-dependent methyltransferase [Nitrococcus mobilis]EAR22878.1 putative sarcosine-dimethylglycine methyltransferase [Nitrococcus mobilis Nb-231]